MRSPVQCVMGWLINLLEEVDTERVGEFPHFVRLSIHCAINLVRKGGGEGGSVSKHYSKCINKYLLLLIHYNTCTDICIQ